MCGIAGILNPRDGRTDEAVRRMVAALRHRGPDGQGVHVDGAVGLGHARLSIIDLAGGQQPLANETGSIWITFNGEIYNYRALREELLAAGHVFRTASDTEVIVHAYEEWGDDCVNRLRGMFAFGLADFGRRRLLLARDPLGIKPLFYAAGPEGFAFASELQALRALPGRSWTIDPDSLDRYLQLQYVPAPRTIFKGVWKLPAAHVVAVGFDGVPERPRAYWQFRFPDATGRGDAGSIEQWTDELERILRESVRAHLVSDVPFGAFLSGGLDSTLVVSLMAQELGTRVRTFSIGFDEREFSELAYARQVAGRWDTEHHEEVVRPDAVAILPALVRHYGEPFGDSSALPTYHVSRLARSHVPMVLSGDGGDEALGGYNSYRRWMRSWGDDLAFFLAPAGRAWLRRLKYGKAWRRLDRGRTSAWLAQMEFFPGAMRRTLIRPEWQSGLEGPPEEFARALHDARACHPLHMAQYCDYATYLPNDILTKVDIASMMHGLEVRTPLVDREVVAAIARMPAGVNYPSGPAGPLVGKNLLRRVLAKYFPADFIDRPKMGFSLPIGRWFDPGGQLRSLLDDAIQGDQAALFTHFDPVAVRALVRSHCTTGPQALDRGPLLWLLLVLELWLRDQASLTSPPPMAACPPPVAVL